MKGIWVTTVLALGMVAATGAADTKSGGQSPAWSMNASVIEACSCPMFCQCYFNSKPAGHGASAAAHDHSAPGHSHGAEATGGGHYCLFNNAYKINKGTYGNVKLDGAKFWISGDLGGDFSDGEMDWAVITFDKSVTQDQRDAIGAIAARLFPVKWKSLKTAEANIDTWKFDGESAHATMDGGKTAEVKLKKSPSMSGKPVVIRDLQYFGAPRNNGFVMMKNEVQAYRVGPNAFETKGTNGFMITVDISSKDLQKPQKEAMAGGY